MMRELNLSTPTHITEALRTNMSGGKTVAQLLAEAAAKAPFMSLDELRARVGGRNRLIVLDVREKDAYQAGHVPGARHLPRGQLELRVNEELPDPTLRILTCLRIRQDLDARRGDAARPRLHARRRARRRHEGLARRGIPSRTLIADDAAFEPLRRTRVRNRGTAPPKRLPRGGAVRTGGLAHSAGGRRADPGAGSARLGTAAGRAVSHPWLPPGADLRVGVRTHSRWTKEAA